MLKCPKCQVPLCRIDYEGAPIHVCPQCRGAVVAEGDLSRIREHRRLWRSEQEKHATIALALEADSLARLACPQCQMAMAKFRVPVGDAALHVDRCPACRTLWFDSGELDVIRAQYAKAAEAYSPEEQARLTRLALAEAEFKSDAYSQTMRDQFKPVLAVLLAVFPAEALAWAATKVATVTAREVRKGLEDSADSGRRWAFALAAIGLAGAVALALLSYFVARMLAGFWAAR